MGAVLYAHGPVNTANTVFFQPLTLTLNVRWVDKPEAADGISDPDRRRAEILVTP
jgi:hypothetical protein